jgi:hypothetical protein
LKVIARKNYPHVKNEKETLDNISFHFFSLAD